MNRNYGGTAFAGSRRPQTVAGGARGNPSAMIGPERATVVNSNFSSRRPAGGYGGSRPRGGGGPPPEVARILNNFKRGAPSFGTYGGVSSGSGESTSYKQYQKKYVPLAASAPAPQPPQQRFQQAPAQQPVSGGGMPGESRRYTPFGAQPQAPPQQAPPMPSRSSGGRRPSVDLRKFQKDYVPLASARSAAPPAQQSRPAPVQDPSDFVEDQHVEYEQLQVEHIEEQGEY